MRPSVGRARSVEAPVPSVLALWEDAGARHREATTLRHSRMQGTRPRVDSRRPCTNLPFRADAADPQCAALRFGQVHPARAGAVPWPPDPLLQREYPVVRHSCRARPCTSRAGSRRCTYRSAQSPCCSTAGGKQAQSIHKARTLASLYSANQGMTANSCGGPFIPHIRSAAPLATAADVPAQTRQGLLGTEA
jgi:hypothetical protein